VFVQKNALSLVACYPQRTIQVILTLFNQPQDILFGFDLDCVSVLYDGKNVYALPRAFRAFSTTINFLEIHRFKNISRTQEIRLLKYQERGFGAIIMDRDNLVLHNQIPLSHTPLSFTKAMFIKYQFTKEKTNSSIDVVHSADKHKTNENQLYDYTYIPYGPGISTKKLLKFLQRKIDNDKEEFLRRNPHATDEDFKPFFIVGSSPEQVMMFPIVPYSISKFLKNKK